MKLALFTALCLVGCKADLPGEIIGTYRITMKLAENTCGPQAIYTTDGAEYSAQLRSDKNKGYWRIADGKPIPGEYKGGKFRFLFSSIVASSDPDAGLPGCQLVQAEDLSGQIVGASVADDAGADDAGVADASITNGVIEGDTTLVGTHVFNIAAGLGSDCSGALATQGGGFARLPCVVKYTLSGVEREDF